MGQLYFEIMGVFDNNELQWYVKDKRKLALYFTASWCGLSLAIRSTIYTLSQKYKDVIFLEVSIDYFSDVLDEYGVRTTPIVVFFQNGERLNAIVGPTPYEIYAENIDTIFI
ncbi:hypothetical protein G6F70_002414 [Rhizopus microsporus]|uniref:Thioredoxin domain-containing protein n=2 Tax=Rhizopus TaxID=4842 RepID=A0A367KGS4_RHIAZ|nr:hypothetical protein G6F71_006194 [Rhizopus microsporus]RCI01341.1 hypothetical protein CU097_011003 [Rhizopus azygosporus]KAG1202268.1 hypothetical protein G6F70_002414 [Rhizopus microsporus]KAG1209752.1 hypothetical protein G6F69_006093 [Rhizopus microsporus]KAG1231174.1 hypothetical protein G6F67_005955 [Rhizopus microsporus]